MSIIERLFPASELKALRASHYDFDREPTSKRRKLSSTSTVVLPECQCTSTGDYAYSLDEDCSVPESWPASRKRPHSSLSNTSSAENPAQCPGPYTQSALFRQYLSTLPPMNIAKHRLRTQSDPSYLTPVELKDFYNQIPLAQSRSRSNISNLPERRYSNGSSANISSSSTLEDCKVDDEEEPHIPNVGQGWTTGPQSAIAAHSSAQILDNVRLTSHELSTLNSLIPGALPMPNIERNSPMMPTSTYAQRQETQVDVPAPSFTGIAISACNDDEDEIADDDVEDLQLGETGTAKVQDYFNIEEAKYNTQPAIVHAEPWLYYRGAVRFCGASVASQ